MDGKSLDSEDQKPGTDHQLDVDPRPLKETGVGPPINVKQSPVRAEIDPPHDFIAIRYSR